MAVGDLHGDLRATREVLRLGGVLDASDHWAGEAAVLVQLGDILDRGDEERAILELFRRLEAEARAAGGRVVLVNGNHEYMNVAGDFRYVTPGGFRDFADLAAGGPHGGADERAGRSTAFRPGGVYARYLAEHPAVFVLDGNVFVHGGLLPKHVTYGVERINQRAAAFLRGEDRDFYGYLADWDSPVMSRHYADDPSDGDCYLLAQTLRAMDETRMIVGHTPQLGGIRSYCHAQVWAIDAGITKTALGARELIEIVGGELRVLHAPARGHGY